MTTPKIKWVWTTSRKLTSYEKRFTILEDQYGAKVEYHITDRLSFPKEKETFNDLRECKAWAQMIVDRDNLI